MGKIRIGIDVDGVLRDFEGQIVTLLKKEGVDVSKSTDYDACVRYTINGDSVAKLIWGTEEWLKPVMVDAPLLYLAKEGYDAFCSNEKFQIDIVTAQNKGTEYATQIWLDKHGFNKHHKTYYYKDKLKAPSQILIDDKYENIMDYEKNSRMGVLISRKYNLKYPVNHRASNILEAYHYLNKKY